MASVYMDDFRKKCREDCERDISAARLGGDEKKRGFLNKKYSIKNVDTFANVGVYIGICFFLGLFTWGFIGPGCMLLGPIVGAIICAAVNNNKKSQSEAQKKEYDAQGDKAVAEANLECERIKAEYEKKISEEEKNYRARVSSARMSYGRSKQLKPVQTWLADEFEKIIRSADRSPYVQNISASIIYSVDAHEFNLHSKFDPEHKGYIASKRGFNEFYIYAIDDFYDRVGMAQALSKLVEFEILRRFPYDPVLPSKINKPKITIDYNDTMMKLNYIVYNPKYKAAVNAKFY